MNKTKVGLMTILTAMAGSIVGNPYLFNGVSMPQGRPKHRKLTDIDKTNLTAAEAKRLRKQAKYSSVRLG